MFKYYLFNKPRGCVTARRDDVYMSVMDYFPWQMKENFHPIGRLDKDTCGLLIITNNGRLTHFLAEPRYHVPKKYYFMALGSLNTVQINNIESGIYLKGSEIITKPSKLEITETDILENKEYLLCKNERDGYMKNPKCPVVMGYITITEGRNHQVKRMLKSQKCHIVYLKRLEMGKIILPDDLKEGNYLELNEKEIERIVPEEHKEILY